MFCVVGSTLKNGMEHVLLSDMQGMFIQAGSTYTHKNKYEQLYAK
jgi:hypothetical protein